MWIISKRVCTLSNMATERKVRGMPGATFIFSSGPIRRLPNRTDRKNLPLHSFLPALVGGVASVVNRQRSIKHSTFIVVGLRLGVCYITISYYNHIVLVNKVHSCLVGGSLSDRAPNTVHLSISFWVTTITGQYITTLLTPQLQITFTSSIPARLDVHIYRS